MTEELERSELDTEQHHPRLKVNAKEVERGSGLRAESFLRCPSDEPTGCPSLRLWP